ncbi:MAG: PIN domain-containing protein [Elusimicrobia bacterium]|nr:PIN domain-containing protein [Elusimicrobiota bacterium]
MPGVVCFDTMIIVWGVLGLAEDSALDLPGKCRHLLETCETEKTMILVPSIVLGELLIREPPEKHQAIIESMYKHFQVASYDPASARQFAEIWRKRNTDGTVASLKKATRLTKAASKAELRADTMIVATAITHGAQRIYTHDKRMQRLAAGFIEALDVPEIQKTKQAELGEDLGIRLEEPPAKSMRLIPGGKTEAS